MATEAYRASTGYEHAANMVALVIQALVYAVIALFVSWPATLISLLLGLFLLGAVLSYWIAARSIAGEIAALEDAPATAT